MTGTVVTGVDGRPIAAGAAGSDAIAAAGPGAAPAAAAALPAALPAAPAPGAVGGLAAGPAAAGGAIPPINQVLADTAMRLLHISKDRPPAADANRDDENK